MHSPQLIFCYGKSPAFTPIARAAGFRYGAQLPCTTYAPVYFADQDWRRPNRAAYMAALAQHRPAVASVIDWERAGQLEDVLSWAEEAAQYCARVMIIPKVAAWDNPIARLPRRIGGADIVLGYSIPTRHGGTAVPLWQFAGWPTHLLGGSPHAQMRLARRVAAIAEVVSTDGNVHCLQANAGRFWSSEKNDKGHWWQLRDAGDTRTEGVREECFRRSCANIWESWHA